jgi:hypothetical protein
MRPGQRSDRPASASSPIPSTIGAARRGEGAPPGAMAAQGDGQIDQVAATNGVGIVMSGRAPADQGLFFGVALVAGAVMSSAFFCGE